MPYHGITYNLDLWNEVAVRWGLKNGEEICIAEIDHGPERRTEEITVCVHKDDDNVWWADLTFVHSNNDLKNSRFEECETREQAIEIAMWWVRTYRTVS